MVTVINSSTRILLIWYLQMHVLDYYKFKCFAYHASTFCVWYSIDIWTVAIKNIKTMHVYSINQIADILYFNNNV